ncbi:hypothetical protein Y032_0081g1433 [Ancylostoma ceylanicum]|uniref:Uncharacterized protein n=1 Tax=Ancylostoma ceylanicum TaxID=53326 RepID=A0A016TS22_9BILA|nr:hypothetical protein Y032_0081g1433 [Ancylostoma ceylanicum]
MDKTNFGMGPKRNETTSRETANVMGRCLRCTDGPAERSAGNESKFSPSWSTMLLDDKGKRRNRMEVKLGRARQVKTDHLSTYISN